MYASPHHHYLGIHYGATAFRARRPEKRVGRRLDGEDENELIHLSCVSSTVWMAEMFQRSDRYCLLTEGLLEASKSFFLSCEVRAWCFFLGPFVTGVYFSSLATCLPVLQDTTFACYLVTFLSACLVRLSVYLSIYRTGVAESLGHLQVYSFLRIKPSGSHDYWSERCGLVDRLAVCVLAE